VNNTDFPVDGRLFYDDDQNLPENLIQADGTEKSFDLQPGETESFARDCEDLQAIFIEDADMRVAVGVSPEASTEVFREPNDFGCGDTITFTFTQNALGTSLEIRFSRRIRAGCGVPTVASAFPCASIGSPGEAGGTAAR